MITNWLPSLSLKSIFSAGAAKAELDALAARSIRWQWAKKGDWPRGWIGSDFRFARTGGFGFVYRLDDCTFFLVPRGWEDVPEWGLAVLEGKTNTWRDLGDFEPIPASWILPEPNIAAN